MLIGNVIVTALGVSRLVVFLRHANATTYIEVLQLDLDEHYIFKRGPTEGVLLCNSMTLSKSTAIECPLKGIPRRMAEGFECRLACEFDHGGRPAYQEVRARASRGKVVLDHIFVDKATADVSSHGSGSDGVSDRGSVRMCAW